MERNEIHILNQEHIEISGIRTVEGFDEGGIYVTLENESLMVYGEGLHVDTLEIDDGKLEASGRIVSLTFEKKKVKKKLRERLRR